MVFYGDWQAPTENGTVAVPPVLSKYAAEQMPPPQSVSLAHARYSPARHAVEHTEPL